MYRGYDIHEVAQKASYEEVAYLLLNGELPSTKQLAEFGQQIAAERTLPAPVVEMLRFAAALDSSHGYAAHWGIDVECIRSELSDNSHAANIRKSIRLIARVSTLITDGWRISQGEEPLPEKPDLTQAGNFFTN